MLGHPRSVPIPQGISAASSVASFWSFWWLGSYIPLGSELCTRVVSLNYFHGSIARTCREAQRRYFTPPLETRHAPVPLRSDKLKLPRPPESLAPAQHCIIQYCTIVNASARVSIKHERHVVKVLSGHVFRVHRQLHYVDLL